MPLDFAAAAVADAAAVPLEPLDGVTLASLAAASFFERAGDLEARAAGDAFLEEAAAFASAVGVERAAGEGETDLRLEGGIAESRPRALEWLSNLDRFILYTGCDEGEGGRGLSEALSCCSPDLSLALAPAA